MKDPARTLFESLASYSKLQELIDNGEAEGLRLECKAPSAPQLTRELKAKLAEAVSGFSNTNGGIIIWGVSTTRHAHSGLDVLTQLEPVMGKLSLPHEMGSGLVSCKQVQRVIV